MLSRKHLPTRLILPSERPKVCISAPPKPSRFRSFVVLQHFAKMLGIFFGLHAAGKFTRNRYALEVRNLLENLGGLWGKLGQLLALRTDLFSMEFCSELSKIRDTSDGMPFQNVRETLEKELRKPLHLLFGEFNEVPFSATSFTQMHRAFLRKDQVWVLVKVQKPSVTEIFQQDIVLIRYVSGILRALSILPNMDWESLARQIEDHMIKELDFRYEASSLKALKKTFGKHGIYVPHVFLRFCGQRVLVMEFIHAALMSDYIALKQTDPKRLDNWIKTNNISPKSVAHRLFNSVYRQIFENNYFHADMHPGSIILLRNSRLAIIDCRTIGILDNELLTKYQLFLKALTIQQYSTAADIYILLATRLPPVDTSHIKANLIRVWRVWETKSYVKKLPYDEKSITYMFDKVNRVVIENKFTVQWTLSRLMKAWENLDSSLSYLSPGIIYHKQLYLYFKAADKRLARTDRRKIINTIPSSLSAITKLRHKFSEYSIFQQAILRCKAQMFQGRNTASSYMIAAFFGLFSLFLLFLECFIVGLTAIQCFNYPIETMYGFQISSFIKEVPKIDCKILAFISILVPYMYLKVRNMKKRFEKVDVVVPDVHAAI